MEVDIIYRRLAIHGISSYILAIILGYENQWSGHGDIVTKPGNYSGFWAKVVGSSQQKIFVLKINNSQWQQSLLSINVRYITKLHNGVVGFCNPIIPAMMWISCILTAGTSENE